MSTNKKTTHHSQLQLVYLRSVSNGRLEVKQPIRHFVQGIIVTIHKTIVTLENYIVLQVGCCYLLLDVVLLTIE